MKFLNKILLWTVIIMAVAFGLSGYLFVDSVFRTSLEREVGKALVVSRDPQLTAEALARFLTDRLPSIKRPKYYAFVPKIPKNSLGKIRLDRLKETYGRPE